MKKLIIGLLLLTTCGLLASGLFFTSGPLNPVVIPQNQAMNEPSTGLKWFYNGNNVYWRPLQFQDTVSMLATQYFVIHNGGGGTTTNALTMNNSGSGATSGTIFNGSVARTISYNTIGAQPTLGFTPENIANKATTFTTLNNTLYPTTLAVSLYQKYKGVWASGIVLNTNDLINQKFVGASAIIGPYLYLSKTNQTSTNDPGNSAWTLLTTGSDAANFTSYTNWSTANTNFDIIADPFLLQLKIQLTSTTNETFPLFTFNQSVESDNGLEFVVSSSEGGQTGQINGIHWRYRFTQGMIPKDGTWHELPPYYKDNASVIYSLGTNAYQPHIDVAFRNSGVNNTHFEFRIRNILISGVGGGGGTAGYKVDIIRSGTRVDFFTPITVSPSLYWSIWNSGTNPNTILTNWEGFESGAIPIISGVTELGDNIYDSAGTAFLKTGGGGGTTTNALTFNNGGSGAASGTTFNGSVARTISYNTIGASPVLTFIDGLTATGSTIKAGGTLTDGDGIYYTLPSNFTGGDFGGQFQIQDSRGGSVINFAITGYGTSRSIVSKVISDGSDPLDPATLFSAGSTAGFATTTNFSHLPLYAYNLGYADLTSGHQFLFTMGQRPTGGGTSDTFATDARFTDSYGLLGISYGANYTTNQRLQRLAIPSVNTVIALADSVKATISGSGVISVTGTAARITSTGGTTPVIDISASYVGQSSITTLGTITTGVWNGTAIANANLANPSITINGTSINLGASGTVTAAAGTLTGTVLNSTVVTSSLTSIGTLVSGSIPYSLITGTPSLTGYVPYSGATGNVNLGANFLTAGASLTPLTAIHAISTISTNPRGILSDQNTADAVGARITMRKSRGTPASPTVITTGDVLGSWTASGYTNAYTDAGKVLVTSTGTISNGVVPSIMELQTMTTGGTLTDGIKIDQAQALTFGAYGTGLLHSGSAGAVTSSLLVGADITNATIDLTTKVTGLLPDGNISSATNWNTAYTNRITSLTNTGSSGNATLISNVLNIPNYTISGLGGVPTTTTVAGFALSGNVTLATLTPGSSLTNSSGAATYNGSAASTFDINLANTNTFTVVQNINKAGLATTPVDALFLQNTTAAAVGAQQVSPFLHQGGFGWGTTAGTSQATDFYTYVVPTQGTVPLGTWTLQAAINGGAKTTVFSVTSGGVVTVGNSLGISGNLIGVQSMGMSNTLTLTKTALAATASDGIIETNTTLSTAGVPLQIAPSIRFTGSVWNTTATAAANQFDWRMGATGVSGTTPTTSWSLFSSLVTTTTASYTERLRVDDSGNLTLLTGALQHHGTTVSALPTASSNTGKQTYVTDATSPAMGSTVVGGGSAKAMVWSNGTNWTVTGI